MGSSAMHCYQRNMIRGICGWRRRPDLIREIGVICGLPFWELSI